MEDVYLIHTYDSITKETSLYKHKRSEHIQKNILQNSHDNNLLFQIYTKIINFVKKNNQNQISFINLFIFQISFTNFLFNIKIKLYITI